MLADAADVAARLGRQLTSDENARVSGLLDEASVMAGEWMRCVPEPVPDAVRIVVSRMVARVLTTGDSIEPAVTGVQAGMGVFTVNRTFSSDATSGGVWLTRQDKNTLRRHGCRGRVGNVGTSKW